MFSGAFFGLVAWLYYLCILIFMGLILFIAFGCSRNSRSRSQLRHTFLWLALTLMLWQLTLFLEVRMPLSAAQLWLGRANFAAMAGAVYLALRFVEEVPVKGPSLNPWLLSETGLLAAFTLLTPLVDATVRVEAEHAISTFGPLFPCYLLHVLGYLAAALTCAFRERRRMKNPVVRGQLTLIGMGILVTGGIALITNALLPYAFSDFRFCDIGALPTLFFILATAYATFIHRLFDLRVILRETFVYGLLLAFVLGTYSSAVFLVTQYLTDSAGKLTQFAVLVIAFSLDPLRRFLERKTDHFLFGEGEADGEGRKLRGHRQSRRAGSRSILELLFPWRRP